MKLILAAVLMIMAAGMGCIEEPKEKVSEPTVDAEPSITVYREFESITVNIFARDGMGYSHCRVCNPNRTVVLEDGSQYTYDCEPWDYAPFADNEYDPHPAKFIQDIPFWDLYAMNDTEILTYCLDENRKFWNACDEYWQEVENATQAEIDRQMGYTRSRPSRF